MEGGQYVTDDQGIAAFVRRQHGVNGRHGEGSAVILPGGEPEAGLPQPHEVRERPACCLCAGIHSVPHRAALHKDDRLVAILAGDGGREPEDVGG